MSKFAVSVRTYNPPTTPQTPTPKPQPKDPNPQISREIVIDIRSNNVSKSDLL